VDIKRLRKADKFPLLKYEAGNDFNVFDSINDRKKK